MIWFFDDNMFYVFCFLSFWWEIWKKRLKNLKSLLSPKLFSHEIKVCYTHGGHIERKLKTGLISPNSAACLVYTYRADKKLREEGEMSVTQILTSFSVHNCTLHTLASSRNLWNFRSWWSRSTMVMDASLRSSLPPFPIFPIYPFASPNPSPFPHSNKQKFCIKIVSGPYPLHAYKLTKKL